MFQIYSAFIIMTSGKARGLGGLSSEPLKGADKTVSSLKAADFLLLPLHGGGNDAAEL